MSWPRVHSSPFFESLGLDRVSQCLVLGPGRQGLGRQCLGLGLESQGLGLESQGLGLGLGLESQGLENQGFGLVSQGLGLGFGCQGVGFGIGLGDKGLNNITVIFRSSGLTHESTPVSNSTSRQTTCPLGETNITDIALNSQGTVIYSAAGNTVRIWDLKTYVQLKNYIIRFISYIRCG